jgi:hypothetical protein
MKRFINWHNLLILALLFSLLASTLLFIPSGPARADVGSYLTYSGDVTALWCETIPDDGSYFWWPLAVNDMNGDGLPDTILKTSKAGEDYKYLARSGIDGAPLWELEHSGFGYMDAGEVGDMNGDGRADVVTYERVDSTFTVSAHNGFNGALFWSENVTGFDNINFGCAADFMGDSKIEAVVTQYNNAIPERYVFLKDWHGNHLRGITYPMPGYAINTVQGADYNHNNYPDLLVWLEDETVDRTWLLEAYDMQINNRLWQRNILYNYDDVYVFPDAGDMNHDNTTDIAVITESDDDWDADEWTDTLFAINGSNGEVIWSENVTSYDPGIDLVCGSTGIDYNDNGSEDILVIETTQVKGSNEVTQTLIAKDGYNGAHIWEEAITGENAIMDAYMAGDLDGDGQDEIIVIASTGLWNEVRTADAIAKNLDGTHIWQQSINGTDAMIILGDEFPAIGDIDGDGKNDIVLVWSIGLGGGDYSCDLIPVRGYDGYHFWEQNYTGLNVGVVPEVRDLDGDGKVDVLASIWWTAIKRLSAFRGYDGTSLWTAQTDSENLVILTGLYRSFLYSNLSHCVEVSEYMNNPVDFNGDGLNDVLVLTTDDVCILSCVPPPEPEEEQQAGPVILPPNPLTEDSSSPTIYAPTDSRIVITGFSASQQVVQANEDIAIFANVANRGDMAGNYTATLKINGEVREVKTGIIAGNTATPVNFNIAIDKPGQYQIDLNGTTLDLTVIENENTAAVNRTRNVILAVTIIGALLVVSLTAILFRRRKTI